MRQISARVRVDLGRGSIYRGRMKTPKVREVGFLVGVIATVVSLVPQVFSVAGPGLVACGLVVTMVSTLWFLVEDEV